MIVPNASDTMVSTRWTPKNAVIPSFHDRWPDKRCDGT